MHTTSCPRNISVRSPKQECAVLKHLSLLNGQNTVKRGHRSRGTDAALWSLCFCDIYERIMPSPSEGKMLAREVWMITVLSRSPRQTGSGHNLNRVNDARFCLEK